MHASLQLTYFDCSAVMLAYVWNKRNQYQRREHTQVLDGIKYWNTLFLFRISSLIHRKVPLYKFLPFFKKFYIRAQKNSPLEPIMNQKTTVSIQRT